MSLKVCIHPARVLLLHPADIAHTYAQQAELERWAKALDCYDAHDFTAALQHFDIIADSSKVLFNIGLIHATLGNHRMAVAHYQQAHLLDQYMAVSFLQCVLLKAPRMRLSARGN